MTPTIAEIVTFKLAKGVEETAFLKASEAAEKFMRERKGFVSRRLTRGADGIYMDYVSWRSMEDAKAALESWMKESSIAPFMQSIEEASMKIDHHIIVSSVN